MKKPRRVEKHEALDAIAEAAAFLRGMGERERAVALWAFSCALMFPQDKMPEDIEWSAGQAWKVGALLGEAFDQ